MPQDKLMKFDPTTGETSPPPYPSHAMQWRQLNKRCVWTYNPWTGRLRDTLDVAHDPFGCRIDPDADVEAQDITDPKARAKAAGSINVSPKVNLREGRHYWTSIGAMTGPLQKVPSPVSLSASTPKSESWFQDPLSGIYYMDWGEAFVAVDGVLCSPADLIGEALTETTGMTIAGDGAAELGKLMREQHTARTPTPNS